MPITQDRMIKLINAALDCDEGRVKAIRAIGQAWENYKRGGISASKVLEGLRLDFMYDSAGLSDARSPVAIATEQAWFGRFAKVNARNLRKQRRKSGKGEPASPDPHPATLAKIRAAERMLEDARTRQRLEDAEMAGPIGGDRESPALNPDRCAACSHAWAVHLPEFKGCGVCGCECQPPECQPPIAGESESTPLSPTPSDAGEQESPGGFNRFANEDAEEDERIARQRAEFAAARANAQARKAME